MITIIIIKKKNRNRRKFQQFSKQYKRAKAPVDSVA